MNRRKFLELGAIVSTLPLFHFSTFASPTSARKGALVLDSRFAGLAGLTDYARTKSMPVHAITGDITQFWYEQLHGRWHEQTGVLGGITGYGAMFCLEQLARDHGKRLIYQGEHRQVSDSHIEHYLQGPSAMLQSVENLETSKNWMLEIVQMIEQSPHVEPRSERRFGMHSSQLNALNEPIYSWLFASKA